ncbi:hypothetical protein EV401DRAFT_1067757 [Pisolithus croceorrhizus]|nr:hypothetical protein EV401DRAFT_1067757 [Pisolithus croceorrhizus]
MQSSSRRLLRLPLARRGVDIGPSRAGHGNAPSRFYKITSPPTWGTQCMRLESAIAPLSPSDTTPRTSVIVSAAIYTSAGMARKRMVARRWECWCYTDKCGLASRRERLLWMVYLYSSSDIGGGGCMPGVGWMWKGARRSRYAWLGATLVSYIRRCVLGNHDSMVLN